MEKMTGISRHGNRKPTAGWSFREMIFVRYAAPITTTMPKPDGIRTLATIPINVPIPMSIIPAPPVNQYFVLISVSNIAATVDSIRSNNPHVRSLLVNLRSIQMPPSAPPRKIVYSVNAM
jgi:hypothetical protein